MLVNLTHHPWSKWSPEQLAAATTEFGEVVDLAFPDIPPEATAETVDASRGGEPSMTHHDRSTPTSLHPPKRLIVIQGKGTPQARRIVTDLWLYWSEALQRYCSIPDAERLPAWLREDTP